MKKLLLLAFLMVGMFTISNAQFLTYTLTNTSSTQTWDYAMADNGSGIVTNELGIVPNGVRTGFVPGFAFNLFFKAQNNLGCGTSQTVPGPTTGVGIPIPCLVPAGIKYKVTITSPFVTDLELFFG